MWKTREKAEQWLVPVRKYNTGYDFHVVALTNGAYGVVGRNKSDGHIALNVDKGWVFEDLGNRYREMKAIFVMELMPDPEVSLEEIERGREVFDGL